MLFQVYLSTRTGTWVMNRVFDYGEPSDLAYINRFARTLQNAVPDAFLNAILEHKLNTRFDHARFALKPSHRLLDAHVTVNDELPNRIISGTVMIKSNIARLTDNGVVFDDGTFVDRIDTIIMATGYSFDFAMIESGQLIPVNENRVRLYKNMYPPDLAHKV
jgi:dimethylaniline monooxygenase (N-oxide forming)